MGDRRSIFWRFNTALIVIDDRYDYDETRYQALGYVAGRVHMLVFTERGDNVRAISLRRATKYESRKYHEQR